MTLSLIQDVLCDPEDRQTKDFYPASDKKDTYGFNACVATAVKVPSGAEINAFIYTGDAPMLVHKSQINEVGYRDKSLSTVTDWDRNHFTVGTPGVFEFCIDRGTAYQNVAKYTLDIRSYW